jgi:hypothetical protein
MDREAKGRTMRRGKVIGVHSVRLAPPGSGSKRPDIINFNLARSNIKFRSCPDGPQTEPSAYGPTRYPANFGWPK